MPLLVPTEIYRCDYHNKVKNHYFNIVQKKYLLDNLFENLAEAEYSLDNQIH